MSVLVVTHCYAEKLPQFAVHLRVQLSSLVLGTQRIPVNVAVCYTVSDIRTVKVLEEFAPILADRLVPIEQSSGELFRRSIGRNIAALESHEDVVWFTDVDYFFGPGCLNVLDKTGFPSSMVWPKEVMIHKDHDLGDTFWQQDVDTVGPLLPNLEDFTPVKYGRAIGGIQIVEGEFARRYGYLNGQPKWQTPRTDGKPFADFKDDIAYRKFCGLNGGVGNGGGLQAIDLPGVYRLRHTATTYQGSA